jgi:hypothetical protein
VEPLIDFGQHLGGLRRELGQGADGADDKGNSHCGLKSFAADVTQYDERRVLLCVFQGNDLEEVASDLLRRVVGAGESEAGDGGKSLRNQ